MTKGEVQDRAAKKTHFYSKKSGRKFIPQIQDGCQDKKRC